jgi:hypothetical protein
VASGSPQAFPALVFSSDDQSGAGPAGFSVIASEVTGLVMSSHHLSAAPSTGGSNDGRNDIATGFWEISFSPVDAATSSELTVDMYPTSYGALLPAGPMAI